MINPEDLRNATDKVLSGLTADESLKFKILQKTASDIQKGRSLRFTPVPVLFSILAVLIISIAALNTVKPVNPSHPGEMNVFAAGSKDTVPPEAISSVSEFSAAVGIITPDDVISMEMTDAGLISNPSRCADLFRILCDTAVKVPDFSPDPHGCLRISTVNGSVIVFDVVDPYLIGDKCWLCPDFFRQFQLLLK